MDRDATWKSLDHAMVEVLIGQKVYRAAVTQRCYDCYGPKK